MSKLLTSLTLAAALTFAAPAYADPANAEADVYREAIFDIHAAASAVAGKTGETAASDLYPESIFDIHLGFAEESFATQSASLQTGTPMGAQRAAPAATDRERQDAE